MAAVKEIEKAIKAHQYVTDSIAYILSPGNRNGDEKCFKSTCIDCHNSSADGLAMQFRSVRFAFDKDDKILAHHTMYRVFLQMKTSILILHIRSE